MVDTKQYSFDASDRSYFSMIKKDVHAMGAALSFTEIRLGEMDIVVAEMLSNLAKYAKEGEMLVKPITQHGINGMEIISLDRGPGMSDIPKMLGDGYSSGATLGHGLGSMKRLSDELHIYSQKDWGTIIVSRIFTQPMPNAVAKDNIITRSLILPKKGEESCGDGNYIKQSREYLKIFMGDGLGHGPEAAQAIAKAIDAFKMCPDNDPCSIIRFMDSAVRKTRGLVATVAVFNTVQKEWRICGVGNIATRMYSAANYKNHLAYNGIIGMNVPRTMNSQVVPYERNQHIMLCSDGIRSKWDINRWPGILRYDLSILATAIYKDYGRGTDDMGITVCKII